jgi:hypothetical protein
LKENVKLFDIKSKGIEMKLGGVEKICDDKIEGYESRVHAMENIIKQQMDLFKNKANRNSQNSKVSENLISSLSTKFDELESENYSLKLE